MPQILSSAPPACPLLLPGPRLHVTSSVCSPEVTKTGKNRTSVLQTCLLFAFFFFFNKCLNIVFNHRNQILRQLSSHSCRIKMELLAGRRGAGDARAQQRKSPRNANFPGISPARHCPGPCSIPLRLGGPDHRHLEAPQAPQPTQTHACPLVLTMKASELRGSSWPGSGQAPIS